MRSDQMRRVVSSILAGVAVVCAGAGMAAETSRFDGHWTVSMTSSGACRGHHTYALAVENGRVRALSRAGESTPRIGGAVAADGAVALVVSAGLASGQVAGRLAAAAGAGTWGVPLVGCTGTWTAQRHRPTRLAGR
jgi:hypothetical protein